MLIHLYAVTENRLYAYSNGTLTNIYTNTSVTFSSVYTTDGITYYISTNSGIGILNNGVFNLLSPDGPEANSFNNMAADDSGNLWVASGKDRYGVGFMKFDGTNWKSYNIKTYPELPSNAYYNVSTKGNKFILSNWGGGVTVYKNDNFTNYNTKNTRYRSDLKMIQTSCQLQHAQFDSKGNIWIANDESAGQKPLSVINYRMVIGTISHLIIH